MAVAVAKLGAQASFVGRLGDDLFGDFILRAWHAVGVETAAVRREPPPTRTTLAFVEVSKDGNREFTFYRSVPAADELLAPEDIRRESLSGTSFANFGSIPLIKDPVRSATRKFAQLAIELDVPIAFDANLREHLWNSLDEFREAIEPMLGLATVIKLSADELAPVLGTKEPQEGARMLLSRGATLVLVSMGHQGAFYATKTFHGTAPAFVPERVLDATGAGDAFLAATLVHLAETPAGASTRRPCMRRFVAEPPLARSSAPSSVLCPACPPETSSTSSLPLARNQTPDRASAGTRFGAPRGTSSPHLDVSFTARHGARSQIPSRPVGGPEAASQPSSSPLRTTRNSADTPTHNFCLRTEDAVGTSTTATGCFGIVVRHLVGERLRPDLQCLRVLALQKPRIG